MALKTLKLEITLPRGCTRRLWVKDEQGNPVEIDDCQFSGKHVEQSGNDVIVKKYFRMNNKVIDASRYRIGKAGCCVRHDGRYCICNDRYIIPHCNHTGIDISHCDICEPVLEPLLRRQRIRSIVFLLESPHMDEYQRGNINCPIAPAMGKTGSNIAEYLGTVLSRIEPQRFIVPGYLVIISNPIQFQTSLHAIHGMSPRADKGKWGTLRDNVWRTLWAEPHIQRCFKKRLEGYCPKVIINACTGDLKKRCSLNLQVA